VHNTRLKSCRYNHHVRRPAVPAGPQKIRHRVTGHHRRPVGWAALADGRGSGAPGLSPPSVPSAGMAGGLSRVPIHGRRQGLDAEPAPCRSVRDSAQNASPADSLSLSESLPTRRDPVLPDRCVRCDPRYLLVGVRDKIAIHFTTLHRIHTMIGCGAIGRSAVEPMRTLSRFVR
jgi:hypothetical protein